MADRILLKIHACSRLSLSCEADPYTGGARGVAVRKHPPPPPSSLGAKTIGLVGSQ